MTNTDRYEPEDRPMTAEEQAAAIEDNKLIRSLEDDDPRKYAHLLGRYDGNRRAGIRIDGVELHVLARLIEATFRDNEYADEEARWRAHYGPNGLARQRLARGLDPVTGEPASATSGARVIDDSIP